MKEDLAEDDKFRSIYNRGRLFSGWSYKRGTTVLSCSKPIKIISKLIDTYN
jgi:hypothetical protein